MKTKIFVYALPALILTTIHLAEAQQQSKIPKIGWLVTASGSVPGFEAFRRGILALGYVESKNIAFESRYAESKLDRLPALVEELVRSKVDVILTGTLSGALAAKNATKTIPIVFVISADPIAAGLVDSLARPGGNITGVTNISTVLAGKRLELLKETVPKLSRVAVLWDPHDPSPSQQWKESQLAARELGLQLHSMEVSSADKFESAFKEATKAGSGALAVTRGPLAASNQKQIAHLAAKNRLPAIYGRGDYVESGGLMSYSTNDADQYRRAAVYVDKILKGAKPAELPVEQPTKFEFVINLKAAKQIGLTIPPNVLARADRVLK
jgi:putative tryptophan/tyrosine transport system substrate-binding protein